MGALSRERLREGLLHGQALIAFANAAQAERNPDTVLAGFRPERFFKLFPHLDTDPGAGWFWHGAPILGPAHLRAAQLRMLERFEAANVLFDPQSEVGGNSRRGDRFLFGGTENGSARRTSPASATAARSPRCSREMVRIAASACIIHMVVSAPMLGARPTAAMLWPAWLTACPAWCPPPRSEDPAALAEIPRPANDQWKRNCAATTAIERRQSEPTRPASAVHNGQATIMVATMASQVMSPPAML